MNRPCRTMVFSVLSLLAASALRAASDLGALNVYPNPVRAYSGQSTVTFDNLTRPATIRVHDARGNLVREIRVDDPAFRYVWDMTNDAGQPVVSGVYLYRITDPSGRKRTGKLAILR